MENFAVDLDKVLDELEESEDSISDAQLSPQHTASPLKPPSDFIGEPHSNWRAPTEPHIQPCAHTGQGYFVPDDASDFTLPSQRQPYLPAHYEPVHNAELYSQPELLQAASKLQAQLAATAEARPSFMSSSPPLATFHHHHHHPDIIPDMGSHSPTSSGSSSDDGAYLGGVHSIGHHSLTYDSGVVSSSLHRAPHDSGHFVPSTQRPDIGIEDGVGKLWGLKPPASVSDIAGMATSAMPDIAHMGSTEQLRTIAIDVITPMDLHTQSEASHVETRDEDFVVQTCNENGNQAPCNEHLDVYLNTCMDITDTQTAHEQSDQLNTQTTHEQSNQLSTQTTYGQSDQLNTQTAHGQLDQLTGRFGEPMEVEGSEVNVEPMEGSNLELSAASQVVSTEDTGGIGTCPGKEDVSSLALLQHSDIEEVMEPALEESKDSVRLGAEQTAHNVMEDLSSKQEISADTYSTDDLGFTTGPSSIDVVMMESLSVEREDASSCIAGEFANDTGSSSFTGAVSSGSFPSRPAFLTDANTCLSSQLPLVHHRFGDCISSTNEIAKAEEVGRLDDLQAKDFDGKNLGSEEYVKDSDKGSENELQTDTTASKPDNVGNNDQHIHDLFDMTVNLQSIEKEVADELEQLLRDSHKEAEKSSETSSRSSRHPSNESVEKFLSPVITSPGICTPREDIGFARVPGFLPELLPTVEDAREQFSSRSISLDAQESARSLKRQNTTDASNKPNRPNSLVGLSKPELPQAPIAPGVGGATWAPLPPVAPGDGGATRAKAFPLVPPSQVKAGDNQTTGPTPDEQSEPPIKVKRPTALGFPTRPAPSNLPMSPPTLPSTAPPLALSMPRSPPTSLTVSRPVPPTSLSIPGTRQPGEVAMEGVSPGHEAMSPIQTGVPAGPVAAVSPLSTVLESGAPQSTSDPSMTILQLGRRAPVWMPDIEAPECMQCGIKFTFTKRRHHCRACGKVFCSTCCGLRAKLDYLESKEARVCSKCYQDLIRAQAYERRFHLPVEEATLMGATGGAEATVATASVPTGVLRTDSSRREKKGVMFSDGVRPGGDLADLDGSDQAPSTRLSLKKSRKAAATDGQTAVNRKVPDSFLPATGLPPLYRGFTATGDIRIENVTEVDPVISIMKDDSQKPVEFAVNQNLVVMVKLSNLSCCVNRLCWSFATRGLWTAGQEEVLIVLEVSPDHKYPPLDIFQHLHALYLKALQGDAVTSLDHCTLASGTSFLGSQENCGVMYVRPSYHCLHKLALPNTSFLFGLFIKKWELPWAKVLPLRLLLRLGAEYRYYPCPLVNVQDRAPVYGEIGHTLMTLLSDMENFQYYLPRVKGLTIHMEDQCTTVCVPRNRYKEVMRALSTDTEQVLAFASVFSTQADSYLVCKQNDQGYYITQAINIQNKPRKITGASFIVFNGSLKSSSVPDQPQGKSSIQEDGVMVHVLPETLAELRTALTSMKDFSVTCGPAVEGEDDETIAVVWTDDDRDFNIGVVSPIDGMALDGVESAPIFGYPDYLGEQHKAIRWTHLFFLQITNEQLDALGSRADKTVDLSRLALSLAKAVGSALRTKAHVLHECDVHQFGLRATIDRDNVGYEMGALNQPLPDWCMSDLDTELIPVIHNAASCCGSDQVILELAFHIINY